MKYIIISIFMVLLATACGDAQNSYIKNINGKDCVVNTKGYGTDPHITSIVCPAENDK